MLRAFAGDAGCRSQTTSWPSARRRSQRWVPRKPAPPVTRTRHARHRHRGPTPGVASSRRPSQLRAARRRCAGRPSVCRSHEPRASRSKSSARNSFHSVAMTSASAPCGAVVGVAARSRRREERLARSPSPPGRRRAPRRPPSSRPSTIGERGRLADVVGVGLEGEAEHRDRLAGERARAASAILLDHAPLRLAR